MVRHRQRLNHRVRKTRERDKNLVKVICCLFNILKAPLSNLLFYPSAYLSLPEMCLDWSEAARTFYYSWLVISEHNGCFLHCCRILHYISIYLADTETQRWRVMWRQGKVKWFILLVKHNILYQEVQYFSVGGSDVTYRRPGAQLSVSHVGLILLITDAACCVGCFHSVCPPSYRLPLFLFMSASPILSVSSPSFCLSQVPHLSSSSICHPSRYPLLFLQTSLHLFVYGSPLSCQTSLLSSSFSSVSECP